MKRLTKFTLLLVSVAGAINIYQADILAESQQVGTVGVSIPIIAPAQNLEVINTTEHGTEQLEDIGEQIRDEDIEAEYELLACLVYAEAGNQDDRYGRTGEYGQELVADVVLNRVESPLFPNTITEVIYQSGQFTSVTDGGLDRAFYEVDQASFDAVARAREHIADTTILYFTAGDYGRYGTPAYSVGDHYFSQE